MADLRIGCRSSRLARMQTDQAGRLICERNPGTKYELISFETSGDRISGSLKRAGGKGHFVRDVEEALRSKKINLAIHCLKDMPGNEPEDQTITIAGYLPRDDPRDVFISARFERLEDLPQGAVVGTSSPRRAAQILAVRPDIKVDEEFRGSIDTRIQKVRDGVVDATLLAAAGLNRVRDVEFLKSRLSVEQFLPAIGQGTLALQCLSNDEAVLAICKAANDLDAHFASTAERTCLRQLNGDCHSAIAGLCIKTERGWRFIAAVYEPGGSHSVHAMIQSEEDEDARSFGERMAAELRSRGCERLMSHTNL